MDTNTLLYIVVFIIIAVAVKTYILPEPEVKKPTVVKKQILKRGRKPTPADGSKVYYTPEEVSVHDKEDDLWLIINKKVYDVTDYVDKHMGGLAIMRNAGKDSTEGFNGEQHPIKVNQILEEYYIGELQE
ncbi:hypothetical protein DICPUDRAFT_83574 [Dictyostelium purpureum]|uniref:Cytochrome b5 heme-binding domain-containing protein n=1 Tax=Dictyostelium purpureum TaxID=5786 RepID=F0ZZX8_DICPU|nr:uncharacterized protein DICPUDRAFT_83574 [Dictyostelium purpureum]EGC30497.1 hypothetical protein DICPUDRAFT_83574 [Dictyostelium purpureum]|eukprot:XP_003292970.1 hypothetical protein DICPUDRAFT_83574 [Dictyostelium purpureum]